MADDDHSTRPGLYVALSAAVLLGCVNNYVISSYGSWLSGTQGPDDKAHWRARVHTGVDIRASVGDAVIACADGVVTRVRFGDDAGGEITIYHAGYDRYTRYIHLKTIAVVRGGRINRGDYLGSVGLFPLSGEHPHVHLELCNLGCDVPRGRDGYGDTEDPMKYDGGCFRRGKDYAKEKIVLTYPIRC